MDNEEKMFSYTNRDIEYILDDIYFTTDENKERILTEEGKRLIFDCCDNYLSSVLCDEYDFKDFYTWCQTYKFGSFKYMFPDVRCLTENIVYFYCYGKFNFDDIRVTTHMDEFLSAVDEILENSKFFLSLTYKTSSWEHKVMAGHIVKYNFVP